MPKCIGTWQIKIYSMYRGSPTSTVSTSTNSTSAIFSAIGIKFVLVEFVISKFVLVEFVISKFVLVVQFFPGPKNRTKQRPYTPGHLEQILELFAKKSADILSFGNSLYYYLSS